MRQLSLLCVYGCSTHHRHSLVSLSHDRVAFIAGSYLVVLDCINHEQRYLPFSAIESLYVSPGKTLMGIIDRPTPHGDTRVHLYSTQPIELVFIVEPDRFGSFIGIAINNDDTALAILHDKPTYMITIRKSNVRHRRDRRAVPGLSFT